MWVLFGRLLIVSRPCDMRLRTVYLGLAFGLLLVGLCSHSLASAISPVAVSDTTRSPPGFDLQGHRGARGLAPENTIPAFRRALELGVTTLEMDVVVAGDGTVVVSHEPWMNRAICRTPDGNRITHGADRTHNIFEMTYSEVSSYDCGSLRHPDFRQQEPQSAPKPRLTDVIDMAESFVDVHERPPVFYNVEIKSRAAWDRKFHPPPASFVEQVLAAVASRSVARRTTIQSFDPRALEAVHRRKEPVRTALLVPWAGNEGVEANLNRLSFTPDVYSPDHRLVDAALVSTVHDLGLSVVPWTVNEYDAARELVALGIDGLITDYPNRVREVLSGQGQ